MALSFSNLPTNNPAKPGADAGARRCANLVGARVTTQFRLGRKLVNIDQPDLWAVPHAYLPAGGALCVETWTGDVDWYRLHVDPAGREYFETPEGVRFDTGMEA